ncbi:unnamed protein product, partial [Polarella glacialis]
MQRRQEEHDGVSKAKQVLGEVLSALNLSRVLRAAPHPDGDLAREATRATGGFELRWPVGSYDVDWAHPYLRIGVLLLPPKAFVQGPEEAGDQPREEAGAALLLAPSRLRVHHLLQAHSWRLVLLRAAVIDTALVPYSQDPQLFNQQLQARASRANAVHMLEEKSMLRKLRHLQAASGEDAQAAEKFAEGLVSQLERQLDVIFPGAVLPRSTWSDQPDLADAPPKG